MHLASVLRQQSQSGPTVPAELWTRKPGLCLAHCSAGVPDAVPIGVQDGQNTPAASAFSLLILGAVDLWTGSWEKLSPDVSSMEG